MCHLCNRVGTLLQFRIRAIPAIYGAALDLELLMEVDYAGSFGLCLL